MEVRVVRIGICHVQDGDGHDEDEVAEADHQNGPGHLHVADVDLPSVLIP